ncbi:MAG: hypothetical protein QXO75_10510 [Nitrososphaerota archaeon]
MDISSFLSTSKAEYTQYYSPLTLTHVPSTAMKLLVFLSEAMFGLSLSLTTYFQTAVLEMLQNSDRALAVLLMLEI